MNEHLGWKRCRDIGITCVDERADRRHWHWHHEGPDTNSPIGDKSISGRPYGTFRKVEFRQLQLGLDVDDRIVCCCQPATSLLLTGLGDLQRRLRGGVAFFGLHHFQFGNGLRVFFLNGDRHIQSRSRCRDVCFRFLDVGLCDPHGGRHLCHVAFRCLQLGFYLIDRVLVRLGIDLKQDVTFLQRDIWLGWNTDDLALDVGNQFNDVPSDHGFG